MAVTSMANSSIRNFQKANTVNPSKGALVLAVAVGGGGGGGSRIGGGGGAGGVIGFEGNLRGTYSLVVGAGGVGSPNDTTNATQGSDSVFATATADGGGFGGTFLESPGGNDGGSGGGSSGYTGSTRGLATQSPGFGNDGGQRTTNYNSGGGGGAGSVGTVRGGADGGHGGAGLDIGLQFGTAYGESGSVAGGGGGGAYTGSGGDGGIGGGGDGENSGGGGSSAGLANTGGGGGSPENGGSGVVLIKVPTSATVSFSGGVTQTSATSGDFTIYEVTATSTTSETVTIS